MRRCLIGLRSSCTLRNKRKFLLHRPSVALQGSAHLLCKTARTETSLAGIDPRIRYANPRRTKYMALGISYRAMSRVISIAQSQLCR